MSKATAKAKITAVFKTNGSLGITGPTAQGSLTGMLDDVYADLAEKVATPTNGDLIKTDASGNPVDTGILATDVSTHLASTANPHSVTKAQVGLGNCDNTADLSKPISTATQTALDLKANSADVTTALADKADIDGSYPLLQAGSAINIAGADKVDAEIVFRPSGDTANIGSGTAKIDKILGNSYAWNQKANNTTEGKTINGVTSHYEGDGVWSMSGTITAGNTYNLPSVRLVSGRKIYAACEIITNPNSVSFRIESFNGVSIMGSPKSTVGKYETVDTESTTMLGTFGLLGLTSGTDLTGIKIRFQYIDLTLIFGSGHEPATVEALKATEIGKFICSGYHAFDAGSLLSSKETGVKTVGFNAWDEQWELGSYNDTSGAKVNNPLTIRSKNKCRCLPSITYYFNADCGAAGASFAGNVFFYDINEVFIKSQPMGDDWFTVITTPDNAAYFTFSLRTEYGTTYKNDICINISHSGIRNGEYEPYRASTTSLPVTTATGKLNGAGSSVVVFADGMKSAGSARDEAWNEVVNGVLTGKARKRLGIINLGDCAWTRYRQDDIYYFGIYNLSWGGVRGSEMPNGKYSNSGVIGFAYLKDKEYQRFVTSSVNGLVIRDDAYSDAASFKAAMNGVYLIYELATPEEYVMDSPWAQGYRVDDWGTEEIVPAQGSTPTSAPLRMQVEYALNVKDTVRNLPKDYVSATGDDNTLARIESALSSAYGITMAHTWDSTNGRYNIAMSGGWQPVASAPASASATGSKGQYYIDANYLYICVASNTWKRVAIATW